MDNVIRFRVFASSPGDVNDEKDALHEAVKNINDIDGDERKYTLQVFDWRFDVVPKIGEPTQKVVDDQLPDYDIYLGIMASRYGGGGTGKEFNDALQRYRQNTPLGPLPHIMFFFRKDIPPIDTVEANREHGKVLEFRDQLQKMGIVGTYMGVRGNNLCFYEQVHGYLRKIVHGFLKKLGTDSALADTKPMSAAGAAAGLTGKIAPGDPNLPPAEILSQAVQLYLERLKGQSQFLTLLGLGRSLQVDLPISEAYVPLRTVLSRSLELRPTFRAGKTGNSRLNKSPTHDGQAADEQTESQLEAQQLEQLPGGFDRDVELGQVFLETEKLGERGVILLGEPGSGKTTGARQIAWRLASQQIKPTDIGLPPETVPVFLRFRNLSQQAMNQTQPRSLEGLRQFLRAETHNAGAPDGCQDPGDELWNRSPKPLLWILDGLDEVGDAKVRQRVSQWLRQAIEDRPQDWFLVTCRFQGYFTEGVPLGARFVEFHVQPLGDEQVKRFVTDWFAAAYGKMLGAGPAAADKAAATSRDLQRILNQSEYQLGHVRELCTNPLLLTILCIVFHEERKLPTGRAELYAHCVRVLLEHWRRDLYQADPAAILKPYDWEAAQYVLARVAWWLHQQEHRIVAPLKDMAAEALVALNQVSVESGLGNDGLAFLERMRSEAGILAAGIDEAESCGFLHLSFQEFLAADYAAREGLSAELAGRARESWWREVALVSLRRSRTFCESFFRELLKCGIAEQDADLAERCLQESLFFSSIPFLEVLNDQQAAPARVAGVLRLLRERTKQVPELADICRRFVETTEADTADESRKAMRAFAIEILTRLNIPIPLAQSKRAVTGSRSTPKPITPSSPGIVFDDHTGLTFVRVPQGEFRMGGTSSDEKPIHTVRLTSDFLLSKYPVTNAQYGRFLKEMKGEIQEPEYWNNRRFNQPEQPVVGVSWEEAVRYCEWSKCELPTEAQWEYACRAGSEGEYCFGDDESRLGEHAWYEKNSNNQTQPVGGKQANAWGLHDMHGNVWEWCQDWYHANYGRERTVIDPTGPSKGVDRVLRGGSWLNLAGGCRAAIRNWKVPSYRYSYVGFRVARRSV
jgi:formylglycine-generating enzyme required for sulfatase activity